MSHLAVRAAGAALLCTLGALLSAAPAHAGPSSPTKVAVSIGDSYISGEAGRWNGNSNTQSGSRAGTDRAYVPTWYGGFHDRSRVYLEGTGADGGCHRSDVAQIRSAGLAGVTPVNLACSGATTRNVIRAASGGAGQNGEAPQADRLASVAAAHDVELVVVSIGGNDLGFASIISACATAFSTSPSWWPSYCYDDQQELVNQRWAGFVGGVRQALDEIRAVMRGAGFADSSYRLVLQSYPSPIPRGADIRYSESGWSRLSTGGCPFWNRDADWARGSLVHQLANGLRDVAASAGAQFLDLRDAASGREVCARGRQLATSSAPPSESTSEWMRFLVSGVAQGDVQESFHPNAYLQRALGRCLALVAGQTGPAYMCRPGGATVSSMTLAATAAGTPTATAARRVRPAELAAPRWPSRSRSTAGRK